VPEKKLPLYDPVAVQYDKVFSRMTLRRAEFRWLLSRLPQNPTPRVLDIGCGNGTLLKHLAPYISRGCGVDISEEMIRLARRSCAGVPGLEFTAAGGEQLPFQAGTFDAVISFFSFRYLDWKAVMPEIIRVLKSSGRLIVVDMAGKRLLPGELPRFFLGKVVLAGRFLLHAKLYTALRGLVRLPAWKRMLGGHPLKKYDEYRDLFRRYFPLIRIETLNRGYRAVTLGVDSGPFSRFLHYTHRKNRLPRLGILDWGIGGLGFYKLVKQWSAWPVLYLSDTGVPPYGRLPAERLKERLSEIVRFMECNNVRYCMIACNAMSTVLEGWTPPTRTLNLAGIIAPALAALERGNTRAVGVVGGRRTIKSGVYDRFLKERGFTVKQRIGQPLSALIERGETESKRFADTCRTVCGPLRGLPLLVLACTHYPAAGKVFAALLPGTEIMDPAAAASAWAGEHWPGLRIRNRKPGTGADIFLTTGNAARMARAAYGAFGVRITAEHMTM